MDAKQVNNAEGNQDGFAISTLKKILKKEGTTMGLVSVNCVTGDYRFGGYVYGRWKMLMERHLNKKARRGSHKNHIKGPRKRTEEDDVRFAQSFEKMIQTVIQVR